jgi:hypothetical protein
MISTLLEYPKEHFTSILVAFLQLPDSDITFKPGEQGWIELVEASARNTLKNLNNTSTKVIFIEPHWVPSPFDINACASNEPDPNAVCSVPAQLPSGGAEWKELLRKLANESANFAVVSLDDVICADRVCAPLIDGHPQFADITHISQYTAVALTRVFEKKVFIDNKLWK